MKKAILISVCLVLGICTVAFSGVNDGVAKGIVHVRPHNAKLGCTVAIDDCDDIVITESSFSFDAFPVFYDLVEFQGCEYGLTWPAWTSPAAFTSCSDLVIGSIALPGDGVSHSWLDCQNASVCVPAWLWLYADGPGQVCMSGNPSNPIHPGAAYVLSCKVDTLDGGELDTLIGWGCAGV